MDLLRIEQRRLQVQNVISYSV